ncbi:hypothetical protein ON010_g16208 [Phytophthora cinnamomi]|nr:hypothetical protein ON010_g16208 [Phytophthora cinnamomi]
MSITGRLDFSDLDSPQAMPPAARAERTHRRQLVRVHHELHDQLGTPPGSPHDRDTDSYRGMITPEQASLTTLSRSSPLSDEAMVDMLTARLEDVMVLISTQRRMLKERHSAEGLRTPTKENDPLTGKRSVSGSELAATEQKTVEATEPHMAAQITVATAHETPTDESKLLSALQQEPRVGAEPSAPLPTAGQVSAQLPEHSQSAVEPPMPAVALGQAAEKPPKLKDIHCRRFNYKEEYPSLGAGVEDFLKEFEAAVRIERLLNESTWSSELKASVLGTFLEGQASRSYHEFAGDKAVTYEEFVTYLKKEFGCRLSQYELGKRLDTGKRAGDTWTEYLTYLKFVQRLLEGDNSRLLLETVCNNACPERKPTLLAKVDVSNINYGQELDKIGDFLIRLKGDGRRIGHAKQGGKGAAPQPRKQGAGIGDSDQKKNVAKQQHNSGGQPNKQYKKQTRSDQKRNGNAHQVQPARNNQSGDGDESADLWMATGVTTDRSSRRTSWLVDSGASHHMCSSREMLFGTSPSGLAITVANGGLLHANVKGSCVIRVQKENGTSVVLLHKVHFVPGLKRNLLSVTELGEHGISCSFNRATCRLSNHAGNVVAIAERRGKLWILHGEAANSHKGAAAMFVDVPTSTLQHWHQRLGHVNFQDLLRMYSKGLTNDMGLVSKKLRFCMSCAEAKQQKNKQPQVDTSTSAPTEEIGAVLDMDLKVDLDPDRNGNKHMLTIVDYGSSYNRVYLLQCKDEAAKHVMDFIPEFQRQYGATVKVIRTDGGGEFRGREILAFLKRHGIRLQLTLTDNSASNGKAERMHRTIMNSARAMLWASKLPERYWGDAARYASYIRNHLPTRANVDYKSPLHVLQDKVPKVAHILRFGSRCTAHIAHKTSASLKKRAERAIIIGISEQHKECRQAGCK